jgi:nitrogen fixation/metabolism regulation signal transduction histidine kinase
MNRPPIWRRKYLIYRFQLEITAYVLSFSLILLLFMYVSIIKSVNLTLNQMSALSPKCAPILNLGADNIQNILKVVFFSYGIPAFVLSLVGGILISHRVAGPIFRLKKVLAQISNGEAPSSIQMRKNDYLRELIPLLKAIAEKIQTKL